VTILSNADLAQRAGVDPWALYAKIAVADPAQVESLAAAFYKAGGNMSQANVDQHRSAGYRQQGYTTAGSSPINFDAEAKATVASPEHLQQIGKILDGVASDLSRAMNTAKTEIGSLEQELSSIESRWATFMQSIGHHLPPEDRDAERDGLIDEAVGKVKSHGATIDTGIKQYEETIFGAQKSMSDLGYVPPATLDDLYGDSAEYIKQLQQKAREEADRLKNNHSVDGGWGKDAHQVAGQIAPYVNDPYFASAFYGELGPELTQTLPNLLDESGSSTAGADMRTFSHMFGTAVSNAQDDPNMQAVADSFLTHPAVPAVAWNRGVMASNGDFPPDWLAKAARVNALDDFARYGPSGERGFGFNGAPAGPFAADYGVSTDTVALWSQDVGRNPTASREALATMGNGDVDNLTVPSDPTGAYQTNIHKLVEYGHVNNIAHDTAGVQRGYGAMFAAASGANDEVDGAHSAAATTFAKALFDDMRTDSRDVGPSAAQDMAKIGGSYVQEMAAGTGVEGDATSDVIPNGFTFPGQHAAFGIPPELASKFMSTFVGDAGATQTFDNAAGQAQHDALLAAAKADMHLSPNDAKNMQHVSEAYGTVAGTENTTTREIVGARDENDEHSKELIRGIISAGVDLIPGEKIAENVPGTLWDIGKHMTNMGLEQVYGATADPRFDALNDTSHAAALTGVYQQASILHEAGYPGTDKIPSDLVDPKTGQMIPVGRVLSDQHLQTVFHDYLQNEGREQADGQEALYDRTHEVSGTYQLGFDTADEHEH
jgi:hypothetical protein